ncbi:hypothetical protein BDZ45DRAFT_754283 [Acephala macrosclerotiorum]|nr:hypothetical protein BDZ45DRAFT_754283 [Acephala macrosclerotiorum]
MTSVECHHTSAPGPTRFQYLYYGSLLRRSHTSGSNQHLLPTQTSPAPPSITVIMKFTAILTILAATAAIAAPVAKPEANPNPIAKASNSFKEISRQLYVSWGLLAGP